MDGPGHHQPVQTRPYQLSFTRTYTRALLFLSARNPVHFCPRESCGKLVYSTLSCPRAVQAGEVTYFRISKIVKFVFILSEGGNRKDLKREPRLQYHAAKDTIIRISLRGVVAKPLGVETALESSNPDGKRA